MTVTGQRIRQKRLELNLTMEELGHKLGVQKSAVNKWEKGETVNIKRECLAKMAELFDVSPVWLMGFENAPDVTVTYTAPGMDPFVAQVGNEPPIIGKSAVMAKRLRLYKAAANVADEALDVAIQLLETMVAPKEPVVSADGYLVNTDKLGDVYVQKE